MFRFVSSLFKTSQWNNDPNQKQLASTIFEHAMYRVSRGKEGKEINFAEMMDFTQNCGWSDREAANRFVHAVSMIKAFADADADTLREAKEEARRLHDAYLLKRR